MSKSVKLDDWYKPKEHQGRSKKQVEGNYKIQGIAILGLLITFIASMVYLIIRSIH